MNEKTEGSGALIGSIIVIIVIILGAVYLLTSKTPVPTEVEPQDEQAIVVPSDEIGSIEADLGASDTPNLDKDLGDIETEATTQ